jgi:hypothetical protein
MPVVVRIEWTGRPALVVAVALWTQGLPAYAQLHPGVIAAVVGALGFTWGLVTLGYLFGKLR